MSINRALRATVLVTTFAVAGLLGAGVASAHVTANVYGSEPQKGGSAAIVFRVPNEEQDAGTNKLEIDFKPEYAISSVRYRPVPGWTAQVEKTPLPSPVKNGKNLDVTNPVTKIIFTAQPGSGIAKGATEFQEFEITASTLPSNVDELMLPTIQTYDNGQVVRWDQMQTGSEEPEHPAPVVHLTAATGDEHGMSASMTTGSMTTSTDGTARWLGGAGLIVGALGLGAAIGAVLRGRKAAK
ncbi:YcnI family copper-binding membrane protein [Amycolatopsis alkalitolerans]|uniref:YcnI family protein n=1 Tax=Amycolatopsis alkalitolerans TaxID=2547244 RepID=A0A5C4M2V5_9PSEU|nr:YcnI family protein [Amycolatopsis alkalitolerans]TNC27338.1 YcnI family protein [Amycolatopsis alkalitolerans]